MREKVKVLVIGSKLGRWCFVLLLCRALSVGGGLDRDTDCELWYKLKVSGSSNNGAQLIDVVVGLI